VSQLLDGQVAVVTGGGGGIGSAIALEFSRLGANVVVVDTGVGVQGEPLFESTAQETVRLIEGRGGTGFASTVSVTDPVSVRSLFHQIVREQGSLDIIVHAAGILRFSSFADSTDEDWTSVFDVHFEGYLNVLASGLPIMAAAGHGRIVGLTSGSGLARTSPGNVAYGTAKRAIAALTWELGRMLPSEIRVSSLSPIAATRMVRAAILASSEGPREMSPTAVDLSAMPQSDDMARATTFLVRDESAWSQGQVFFSTGSEHTVITQPRLLECVATDGVDNLANALATLVPEVFAPAEAAQHSGGGSNSRFGDVFSLVRNPVNLHSVHSRCLIVSDDGEIASSIGAALAKWGLTFSVVGFTIPAPLGSFDGAQAVIRDLVTTRGLFDSVVVVGNPSPTTSPEGTETWDRIVESHSTVRDHVMNHSAWLRASARVAIDAAVAIRVVHVIPALTSSGRTVAQAISQLVRNVNDITSLALDAYSVHLESSDPKDVAAASEFVTRLVTAHDTLALRGAELVAGRGWLGIRSHPAPGVTASTNREEISPWVGTVFAHWLAESTF
jgi:NAD(P)-dependent dehydrogenase (short-subunit alcohol dehydrogenase family)